MYTPATAGPVAMPMNSKSAPTAVEIPMNSLGADETTMFHVAVIASDSPDAITARFADTSRPVEWNASRPSEPIRLITLPMIIGFLFPILFMMNGVTLANTRNITMNGSWTFAASTASPPKPSGTGLLTSCTMDGYAMNIVIPTATSMRYDGMRILSL